MHQVIHFNTYAWYKALLLVRPPLSSVWFFKFLRKVSRSELSTSDIAVSLIQKCVSSYRKLTEKPRE